MPKATGKLKKSKQFAAIIYLTKDGTIKYKTADVHAFYLARSAMFREEEEPVILSEIGASCLELIESKTSELGDWFRQEDTYNKTWQIKRLEERLKRLEDCLSSFKRIEFEHGDGDY